MQVYSAEATIWQNRMRQQKKKFEDTTSISETSTLQVVFTEPVHTLSTKTWPEGSLL